MGQLAIQRTITLGRIESQNMIKYALCAILGLLAIPDLVLGAEYAKPIIRFDNLISIVNNAVSKGKTPYLVLIRRTVGGYRIQNNPKVFRLEEIGNELKTLTNRVPGRYPIFVTLGQKDHDLINEVEQEIEKLFNECSIVEQIDTDPVQGVPKDASVITPRKESAHPSTPTAGAQP